MPLPESLHESEYYEKLAALQGEALTQSNRYDRRLQLGRLALGYVRAMWRAQFRGLVTLGEGYLWRDNTVILNSHPTRMRIYKPHPGMNMEITTFDMNLEDGDIEVFRRVTSPLFPDFTQATIEREIDGVLGLSKPTDEDLQLLYAEMERGASGLHRLDQPSSEES